MSLDLSAKLFEDTKNSIRQFEFSPKLRDVGRVVKVGDGIVTATGLPGAFLGEVIENPNGFKGVVLNLTKELVEIIVLKGFGTTATGSEIFTTGSLLEVPVGEKLVGRVVNPLGEQLDGLPLPESQIFKPIERKAYGIIKRSPVERPLQTGIKAIDSMIPIGRGQRELIIGDRGIGKTAIAIDTIINQKNNKHGEKVHCFYVAIGQKTSKVAQIVAKLKESGALDYTTVIIAGASDPVSLQYLAPYAGTAMAEHYLDSGKDALIVYDDLTKHAWAYRELSLVLRRSPGREAYPGDVFYLHSKLLERSCQLSEEMGSGSLTALPIIETQSADVSAYIPTNVISITDGQIYLERELFHSGFRPAINVGLSVSRVGGKAQVKQMKKLTGKLRLELAQYRELTAFSQFAADLDNETREKLSHGEKVMEILKQDQFKTLRIDQQILIFWIAVNGFLSDIKTSDLRSFETEMLKSFEASQKDLLAKLNPQEELTDEITVKLTEAVSNFKKTRNYDRS